VGPEGEVGRGKGRRGKKKVGRKEKWKEREREEEMEKEGTPQFFQTGCCVWYLGGLQLQVAPTCPLLVRGKIL